MVNCPRRIFSHHSCPFFFLGIRLLDLFQLATDLDEANSLGHKSDIIEIYSNSWGPIDDGSVAEGPGRLLQRTFEMGVRQVGTA